MMSFCYMVGDILRYESARRTIVIVPRHSPLRAAAWQAMSQACLHSIQFVDKLVGYPSSMFTGVTWPGHRAFS